MFTQETAPENLDILYQRTLALESHISQSITAFMERAHQLALLNLSALGLMGLNGIHGVGILHNAALPAIVLIAISLVLNVATVLPRECNTVGDLVAPYKTPEWLDLNAYWFKAHWISNKQSHIESTLVLNNQLGKYIRFSMILTIVGVVYWVVVQA